MPYFVVFACQMESYAFNNKGAHKILVQSLLHIRTQNPTCNHIHKGHKIFLAIQIVWLIYIIPIMYNLNTYLFFHKFSKKLFIRGAMDT